MVSTKPYTNCVTSHPSRGDKLVHLYFKEALSIQPGSLLVHREVCDYEQKHCDSSRV